MYRQTAFTTRNYFIVITMVFYWPAGVGMHVNDFSLCIAPTTAYKICIHIMYTKHRKSLLHSLIIHANKYIN